MPIQIIKLVEKVFDLKNNGSEPDCLSGMENLDTYLTPLIRFNIS